MAMWVGREEEIPAYRLAHNQEATPATLGLFQACESGDAVKVGEFLAQNGRANYFDDIKGGTTPVHAACTLPKDASALEALIAFAKTEPGDDLKPLFDLPSTVLKATPLHCAAEVGNSAQLEVLLKLGIDANGENAYGDTPLLVACANNQAECVKLLLEHNADECISYGPAASAGDQWAMGQPPLQPTAHHFRAKPLTKIPRTPHT